MRNALWTDSKDQSLWFYYQFLMTTITGQTSIIPDFSQIERIDYLKRQVGELREMLDGAEDRKWICNALLEYSIALYKTEERQPKAEERRELGELLMELRSLDPLRCGRWADLANSLSL
jgi:geranylgeranyl transferase type-2 subunit alpha